MSIVKRPLTELQEKWVDGLAKGLSPTAAAREAGYADPSGIVGDLMVNRAAMDAAVLKLRQLGLRWSSLLEQAKHTLYRAMTEQGPRWTDKVAAAKCVIEETRKLGQGEMTFAEAAEREDLAQDDRAAVALRILGKDPASGN